MTTNTQRSRLGDARRVVVKFGTRVLVDGRGRPNPERLGAIVTQIARLRAAGREVVLVSSGAVGAGLDPLGYKTRPKDLVGLQMSAAVGQTRLMSLYGDLFAQQGLTTGQILLNHDDLKQRNRHLNARNVLIGLLHKGVIPIVNENDVVSVDEIRLGDNDVLAALVAVLVDADALVLCTSVNGLREPAEGNRTRRIAHVPKVTAAETGLTDGKGSSLSIGGMATKLEAAAMANKAGIPAVIVDGRKGDALSRTLAGEDVGTMVGPPPGSLKGKRKHWIAFFHKPAGRIVVDDGATRALTQRGKSLLPAGILNVTGEFKTGAVVEVVDPHHNVLATGLTEFDADTLRQISGHSSKNILQLLGPAVSTEAIHRDNLAILYEQEISDA